MTASVAGIPGIAVASLFSTTQSPPPPRPAGPGDFVDLGLAIKRGSPFRTTLIVELSDTVETMYVPTRAAYVGGGYEVTNSAVQPGSGEMLVESALRLLRAAATDAVKH